MKLRRFLVIAMTAILVIVGYLAIERLKCPGEIDVAIGEFESKDAGLRASIAKLASEVRKCPEVQSYRITWVAPDPDFGSGILRRSTFFYRSGRKVGYEADAYSGSFGRTYFADDQAIRAVAAKGGTLEDFIMYDRSYEQSTRSH